MVNKWTHAALSAPHTKRHLDAIPSPGARALVEFAERRAAKTCPACGEPMTVIRDLVSYPGMPGQRVLPCDCLTERKDND
jgi:hypothetical protein